MRRVPHAAGRGCHGRRSGGVRRARSHGRRRLLAAAQVSGDALPGLKIAAGRVSPLAPRLALAGSARRAPETALAGFSAFSRGCSMRRTSSRIAFAVWFTIFAWGCDSSTGADSESIALSLSTNSLAMAQGASQQITITIQRSSFDKPVALSIQGLPQGISAEFAQSSLPAGVSTTLLTVEVAGNAAPTTNASFTVRASGEGITEQTQTVTISITITGTYTLGLLEPEVRVAQGGGGNAPVLVTRNNGNAGDVALSVGALPAGV